MATGRSTMLLKLLFIYCLTAWTFILAQESDEKELISSLFRGYSKDVIPNENRNKPLQVSFALTPIRILDFDVEKQRISLVAYTNMNWIADNLRWSPASFKGLNRIIVRGDRVWTPDIQLMNAMAPDEDLLDTPNIHLSSDGRVMLYQSKLYTASCPTDPNEDVHECRLKFASWVYPGKLLDLKGEIGMSEYSESDTWRVMNATAVPNYNNTIYDITFTLTLTRKKSADVGPVSLGVWHFVTWQQSLPLAVLVHVLLSQKTL